MNARAPLVALKDVRLQDGRVQLFDGVDMALEPRVRACLVGRNGAGKSTLMKIVAGRIEPDSGERSLSTAGRIAYVPQEPLIEGETLRDYACAGGAEPWDADAALQTFGLDPARPTAGLSGGETRRAALARAFAEDPDLILLDEPTNHLDIFAIETLEAELQASRAAALIVSHDRAFLERVTRRCFWLAHRKVRTLDEGFAAFEPWAEKMEAEEAENLRRLTKAIERETYTFYRSITAQRTRNEGRARNLEAMRQQKAALMRDKPRELELAIDAGGASGKLVAELKGVSKGYDGRELIKDFTTRVMRGDRVAIVGPNGAGKSTLVKTLLGEIEPDSGTVRLGTGLEVVYLDQSRDELKADTTLWDALTPGGGDSVLVRGHSKHVAAYAKDFLFNENQLRQPVSTLSGGERNRLLLARALAKPANMLVLDEPTNDLDMDTLNLLEELLADYEGTLILVSHDRDFINRLATSTIALNGHGQIRETPGGWNDFIRQNPGFFDKPEIVQAKKPAVAPKAAEPKRAVKLSYKDQRRLEELDGLMPKLQAEIAAHEKVLEDANLYAKDPARFDRTMKALDAARANLAASEEEWLELEEKKEALA
ncbi:ABC-F family ATP-binding cassette domain-containing protein [Caulobacter sp. 17J80-11]|uniref:ABC-F family ATP-binding cassette domain-containing protein n=1 Tax=Caulobacter sp. 17J80-11 TaxID=2763502 RepID=UPI0016538DD8|nr:ATP-binding cassette domain-containing protein [Caulobacter sp. 17J80-11]MBC6980944.1 ATP-binding cassette domain-containing protein [Caulobacter sp. 17J80-11]